jgi:single-stranded DNA-specific DHH superfamily exonuclease
MYLKKEKDVAGIVIKRAIDFIKSINPDEKIVIAHGHDNDTICSAVIMKRVIEHFTEAEAVLQPLEDNFAVNERDVEAIQAHKPNKIIFVDIAHVASEKVMREIDHKSTLYMDHHHPIKFKNAIYCNPRNIEKRIYMPVSYLAYRVYKSLGDPAKVAWVAGVGVLSDHGMSTAKDLFDYIKKIDPRLTGEKADDEEDLFEYSVLGKLAKTLDNARVVKGREGAIFAAQTLARIKSYNSILNAGSEDTARLRDWNIEAEKEFRRLVSDFNKKRKLLKRNIIFYEIPSKMNIKSSLSGYLVKFFPNNVLVLAQHKDGNFEFSFRRGKNDDTDLNKMARNAVKGIPGGEGGGHETASGARIQTKYLPKFLKQL